MRSAEATRRWRARHAFRCVTTPGSTRSASRRLTPRSRAGDGRIHAQAVVAGRWRPGCGDEPHRRHRRRRHVHRPDRRRRRQRRGAHRQGADHGRQPGLRRRSPRSPPRASTRRSLDAIVHGTTTTTNAMLERKIANVGLITTRGFRDVLELGRRTRPTPYGLNGRFVPLIQRASAARGRRAHGRRRRACSCRSTRPQVAAAATQLIDARRGERRHPLPAHLRQPGARAARRRDRARALAEPLRDARATPSSPSSASTSAARRPRSTPRCSRCSTATSSGCRSELAGARLRARAAGHAGQRRHGVGAHRRRARGRDRDVGPGLGRDRRGGDGDAGGPSPAIRQRRHLRHGRHLDRRRADPRTACRRSRATSSSSTRCRSTCRWSTCTRSAPAAARSPRSTPPGMLQVGPESAGATPGPICYGRGGTRPTITDANLVLGRLDPERLLAGRARGLDGRDPRRAASSTSARRSASTPTAAAAAIVRVANDKMAGAIRMVSLARGHDPRDFALFAFGGAGPLHAAALARELGIPKRADPGAARASPTRSAASSPTCATTSSRTVNQPLEALAEGRVAEVFAAQIASGADAARARERRRRARRHAAPRRHAVPGPEPHPAGGDRLDRRSPSTSCAQPFDGGLLAALRGRAAGDPAGAGQPAHGGDRQAQAGVAEGDRGGEAGGDARRGAADDAAGLVRRRLARHAGLRARAAAGRRAIRRAGDRRAARLHHGGRAGQPRRASMRSATSS